MSTYRESIDWKAAAISAGAREAKAVIYAKTLEKVAVVLFICNLVLLFERCV